MKRRIINIVLITVLLIPFLAVALEDKGEKTAVRWSPIEISLWKPLQIFNENWNIYGLRLNLIYAKNRDIWGFDFGLGVNSNRDMFGIQMTGLVNAVRSMYGIQFAGLANNVSSDMYGTQFSLINVAKYAWGVQVGIVNYTRQMAGFQFGLVNIIKDGWLPLFPVMNIGFSVTPEKEVKSGGEEALVGEDEEEEKPEEAGEITEEKSGTEESIVSQEEEASDTESTTVLSEEAIQEEIPSDEAAVSEPENREVRSKAEEEKE
jgi:hypothetical protein